MMLMSGATPRFSSPPAVPPRHPPTCAARSRRHGSRPSAAAAQSFRRDRRGRASLQEDRSARRSLLRFRARSEEHTSELQSLMRISYAVFCLKTKSQLILNDPDLLIYTSVELNHTTSCCS